MANDARNRFEDVIFSELAAMDLGPSHSFEHLRAVLFYALELQATYGGDRDVITAAALLHDAGRSDASLHGVASIQRSIDLASRILAKIEFPAEKIPLVLAAIAQHDQPHVSPDTLEGKILKDADFLAGFGATGVIRSAMWTGESGGALADFQNRIVHKMRDRIASLEFARSRYDAHAKYLLSRYIAEKSEECALAAYPAAPYVVIEGISGSGKTTQVHLLAARFRENNRDSVEIHEPTPWYRDMRQNADRDPQTQVLLLLLDRQLHLAPTIRQSLARGQPVIASRSYLSSMVYQGGVDGGMSPSEIALMHAAIPQPTHIFILDVDPEEALKRINQRIEGGASQLGEHEQLSQLASDRSRFLFLKSYFPHLHIIDTTTAAPDEVSDDIWKRLS